MNSKPNSAWIRCMAFALVLISLCCLTGAPVAAEKEAEKIGSMTLRECKVSWVFPGTLDSTYTLTTWLFEEQEDVPYISLREYISLLFAETLNPVCLYDWDRDTFLVTHNEMTASVDMASQTVSCANWHLFFGPNAANALPDGILDKSEFIAIRPSVKNPSFQTEPQGFSVCLKDYGVEMIRFGEDILVPFAVAQTIFAAPFASISLAYNGDDYYDIVNSVKYIYGSSQMAFAPNPYANRWYSGSFANRKELSQAYANYNYAAMCMLLDIIYGHKDEKGITDFNSFMESEGIKEALLSTDPKDDVEQLTRLFTYLFDSGHDAEVLSRSIIDSEGVITKTELMHSILNIFGFDTLSELNAILTQLITIGMKLFPIDKEIDMSSKFGPDTLKLITSKTRLSLLKPLSYGSERVDIVGDTCVIYFDAFREDRTRSESFYTKLPTKDDIKNSSFALFYYAFDKIKKDGNIKNVVIDLSDNGGGYAAALVATLGFLSRDGEVKITYKDQISNHYRTEYYHVDTNLDGSFDDEDGYGGQYDFYIMTTNSSYSCGNAFPYFAQHENLAKIIGENPGGGDCVVSTYLDAYGRVGKISGFKKLGTMEGDIFVSDEKAVTVDYPMTTEESDGILFHPEKIAEYISGLAK